MNTAATSVFVYSIKTTFLLRTFIKRECITFCCGVPFVFCTSVVTWAPLQLAREIFNGVRRDRERARSDSDRLLLILMNYTVMFLCIYISILSCTERNVALYP